MESIESEIDEISYGLYQIFDEDRRAFDEMLGAPKSSANKATLETAGGDEAPSGNVDGATLVAELWDYGIGAAFGRWDIRYATGDRQSPELPDPFDPLPVCPPGMLQNAVGLPAAPADVPDDYPLRITWPGLLVDDDGHPEDILARVRDALAVIWGDRSSAIEQEACEILGVRTLRDYFAEKKSGGKFFKDHLKRYSKSRRQAPIYWPLSTESGTYTLWLYYHRFQPDMLYRCLRMVEEKLSFEEGRLAELSAEAGADPSAAQRKRLADQEVFVSELRSFVTELSRVAPLWKPDLNDGVIINSGPIWRMLRNRTWQKKVKEYWDKLVKGDYDWAHLAMHLWPERVVPKCQGDRSLAIAHGLEELLWVEDDGSWRPLHSPSEEAACLLHRYSGREITAALQQLRKAPLVVGQSLKGALKGAHSGVILAYMAMQQQYESQSRSVAGLWSAIDQGELDDCELAMFVSPERLLERCQADAEFAELHGIRGQLWFVKGDTRRSRLDPEQEICDAIAERSSAAVKAALTSLLKAPVPSSGGRGRRKT